MLVLGHYRVAVLSGGEAGPDAYHHGGVGDAGAQIALVQYGVHQGIRVQLLTAQALRVGEDGYRTLRQQGQRLRRTVGADGPHILYHRFAVGDGGGEAHRPPYGGGAGQVGHDHLHPGAVQPQSDAGGNVACAAYQNQHSITSYFRYPYNNTTREGCQQSPVDGGTQVW